MRVSRKHLILLPLIAGFLLTGCGVLLPTPDMDVEALYTQAAQTIQAQLTRQAQDTQSPSTPQPGSGIATPTVTAFPTALPTALPTATPTKLLPTPTSLPPTPTPVQLLCDHARFVKDVTVADGTTYSPGAEFTKVWRLRNAGSCTWDTDYSLVFVSGDRMSAPQVISLCGKRPPGRGYRPGSGFYRSRRSGSLPR